MSAIDTICTLGTLLAPSGCLQVHRTAGPWIAAWTIDGHGTPHRSLGVERVVCAASATDAAAALAELADRVVVAAGYESEYRGRPGADDQDREMAAQIRTALAQIAGTRCEHCPTEGSCDVCEVAP